MTELTIETEDVGKRVDAFLAGADEHMSRNAFQRLVEEGCVTVNGKATKVSYRVALGDIVRYTVPPTRPADAQAEELPLDIVYEDADLVVINKAKGMVVHPAPGAPAGTLVNALLAHCRGLSTIGGVERPGIVHRLDKDTSGLMVVAKNDEAHRALQKQIQARTAIRKYLVLVWGNPRFEQAIVDASIGRNPTDRKKMAVIQSTEVFRSRPAATEFRVLERFGPFTLLEAKLQTGRTHQVRVHAAYAGHPVVGDPLYSNDRRLGHERPAIAMETNRLIDELRGQALHAYSLSFKHPATGEEMEFTSALLCPMERLLEWIRKSFSSCEARGRGSD